MPKLRLSGRQASALIALAAAIAAALQAFGVIEIVGADQGRQTQSVHGVQLDAAGVSAYRQAAEANRERGHLGLRDETPPGRSAAELEQARARSQQAARETTGGGDAVLDTGVQAAPEQAGCRTRLVRNRSSRGSARPALFVLHYTVSANRPGWSDVNAIEALGNNPRSQVSWNYVIDNEGHCKLNVPESQKPWTQGYFNPWSISVEVINTGREPTYAGTAGLRKLGQVAADATARWGIPLRRGLTRGCQIVRSGVVDHDQLDCGNNHTDIRPYSVEQVLDAARAARGPMGRKERIWRAHHDDTHRQIRRQRTKHGWVHGKLRDRCGEVGDGDRNGCVILRRRNRANHAERRELRSRNRTLHRLIAREQARRD